MSSSIQSRLLQHLKGFLSLIGSEEIAEMLMKPEHQTNVICAPLEKVGEFVHGCIDLFHAQNLITQSDELDIGHEEDITSVIGAGLNVQIDPEKEENGIRNGDSLDEHKGIRRNEDSTSMENSSQAPPTKKTKVDVLSFITDTKDELKKKIDAFIEKKRQQNNISNQLEFCNRTGDMATNDPTCSRIDACMDDRATKVRMTHADTSQVTTAAPEKYGDPPVFCIDLTEIPDGVDERVRNAEYYLRVKTTGVVPKDVYQRLKAIESRILEIERNGTLTRAREWEDSDSNRAADSTKKAFNRMPS